MRKILALLLVLLGGPAYALPPGCTASACASGEFLFLSWPNLMADLVAQAASGSSTYFDQGINNLGDAATAYAWKTTSAPTLTANADGKGNAAWTFAAGSNNVAANFTIGGAQAWPIAGVFSFAIVADLSASLPSTGTTVYPLASTGLAAAHGWVLGIQRQSGSNYALCWIPTGGAVCTILSGTLSTGTPHVIVFAWSSVDQLVGACIDGGVSGKCATSDWTTSSISASIQSSTLTDATLQIGSSGSSSYTTNYYGNIYRAMLFKESLQNLAKAAQVAYLQAVLAVKY
jgi:hypothetical protein